MLIGSAHFRMFLLPFLDALHIAFSVFIFILVVRLFLSFWIFNDVPTMGLVNNMPVGFDIQPLAFKTSLVNCAPQSRMAVNARRII